MLERIGISLDERLLSRFDALIHEKGYANRSEAVRDLIREKLVEREWAAPSGTAVAAVVLVYDHEAADLCSRMTKLEHSAHHLVVTTSHVHMDHNNCLEIVLLRGPGKDIKRLGERLISMKGVKLGRFIPATTGKAV